MADRLAPSRAPYGPGLEEGMKLQGLRRRPSFGRRMTAALGALAAVGVLALAAVTTGVAAAGPTARPPAQEDAFQCIPQGVAAYASRIHVRCVNASGDNVYF